MESNGRPRHKSTYLWIFDFWQRNQNCTLEKTASPTNSPGHAAWLRAEESKESVFQTQWNKLTETSSTHQTDTGSSQTGSQHWQGSVAICQEDIYNRHPLAKGNQFSPLAHHWVGLNSRVDARLRSSFVLFWLFLSCWFLSFLFCISLLLYERKNKRKI